LLIESFAAPVSGGTLSSDISNPNKLTASRYSSIAHKSVAIIVITYHHSTAYHIADPSALI
jgi:hypothetical protein